MARDRARRPTAQLKTESEILQFVRPIYSELGHDPHELVEVTPSYGGWLNALRFCVHRADGATTWIARVDVDQEDRQRLIKALKSFALESQSGCDPHGVSRRKAW